MEAEGKSLMDQLRGEALKFHKPGKEVKVIVAVYKSPLKLCNFIILSFFVKFVVGFHNI